MFKPTYLSLLLLISTVSFCIGQQTQWKSNFTILNDKLLFNTNNLITGHADEEIYYPTLFRIFLPKNMLTYSYSSTEFKFFYPDNQAIFIITNWSKPVNARDTMYSLSKDSLYDVFDGGDLAYFIKPDSIHWKRKRSYILIKYKYATILLYNILKQNRESYLSFGRSFKKL